MLYHRITLGGANPLVVGYPTQDTFERAHVDDANVYEITCEDDCAKLSIKQQVDVINYLAVGKKIKSLHDRAAGAKRLWAILTTRKDPESETVNAGSADNPGTSAEEEKTLATPSESPVEGQQAEQPAAADRQENEEADMAKKAAKKSKTPKTPKAKATKNVDKFGLRVGSKNAQAAALMARARGASMSEVKEATGDTKYNLVEKLKNDGHKVKKEGETYFLTAKGE